MTTLERTLLAAYSLLLVAMAVGLTALAWDQGRQLDLDLGEFRLTSAITSGVGAKWAFSLVMALVGLFGGLTLALALRPVPGPGKGILRLRQQDGTVVEVSAATLERRLREELELLPDVAAASARIRLWKTAIDPDIAITPAAGSHPSYIAGAVVHTTLAFLETAAPGATVRRPTLRVDYDESIAPVARPPARGLLFPPGAIDGPAAGRDGRD